VVIRLIYRPGSDAVSDAFFFLLSVVLESVALYKCQIIVAGDFNIHVNCHDDADAARLLDIIDSFDCTQQIPHVPTHSKGGTLDLVITKSGELLNDLSVNPPKVISDHSLITWRLHLLHQPPIIKDREIQSWKRVDKAALRTALTNSDLCRPDNQCTTAEDYFTVYNSVLQSLADQFAPVTKLTTRR